MLLVVNTLRLYCCNPASVLIYLINHLIWFDIAEFRLHCTQTPFVYLVTARLTDLISCETFSCKRMKMKHDQWSYLPMSIRRYEVEAAVNSCIFDIMPVESRLIIIVLLKLFLHIISYRLPTVHNNTALSITQYSRPVAEGRGSGPPKFGRNPQVLRSFLASVLSPSCALRLTHKWSPIRYRSDGWPLVGKPSAIGQPTRPTQPFILLRSINE